MKWLWTALLAIALTGCGLDGSPVPPGSERDPNIIDDPDDFTTDNFFL